MPGKFIHMAVALTLSASAFFGISQSAQAQYRYGYFAPFIPNIPLGGFRSPYGSFYFGQAYNLNLYKVLPNGQYYNFNYSYYQSGLPLFNNFVAPVYLGGYSGMNGGFGTSYNSYNPGLARSINNLHLAQQQMPELRARNNRGNEEVDRWATERMKPETPDDIAKSVDINLINPSNGDILNGRILNELAARIMKREKEGKRASSALCPPELMDKIVFAGGGSADAANVLRRDELAFPASLKFPQFEDSRKDLAQTATPVLAAVHDNKKVEPRDSEKLLLAAMTAHDLSSKFMKDAPIVQASEVARFFNALESASKYLKAPESVGIIGTKWSTTGSNVSELVNHMSKYKLRFGHVPEGEESAYYSLHRAMLSYYAALSPDKK